MIVAIDNKGVNVINKLNDASGGLTVMTRSDLRSYIENSLTGRVKSRPNLTQRFTRPAFTGLRQTGLQPYVSCHYGSIRYNDFRSRRDFQGPIL